MWKMLLLYPLVVDETARRFVTIFLGMCFLFLLDILDIYSPPDNGSLFTHLPSIVLMLILAVAVFFLDDYFVRKKVRTKNKSKE